MCIGFQGRGGNSTPFALISIKSAKTKRRERRITVKKVNLAKLEKFYSIHDIINVNNPEDISCVNFELVDAELYS